MRRLGRASLILLAGIAATGHAQTVPEQRRPASVVDIVPVSDKFPAAWYPPDNDVTNTGTLPKGAPYSGVLVTRTSYPNPQGGAAHVFETRSPQMRDSAGRLRYEIVVKATLEIHAVSVDDPVSHCHFDWSEPARGEPVASVSCMARKVHRSPEMMTEAKFRAAATEETRMGETSRSEPLGERNIGGVLALGQRSTRISSNLPGPPVVNEVWWSPEIKEIVLVKTGVGTDHEYDLQLEEIRKEEPAAELFYPPKGYRIVGPERPAR